MAEFILKDWYGKEKAFDHDTIYVRDTDGNLIPFKQEASSKITILKEQEFDGFAYDSNFGYARMLLSSPFELVIGKQYTVMWDGEEYTCTAYDASVVLEGAVYIGNGSAFSQPSNGEPFAILCVNGACVFSGISDPAESHTIGIYQKTSGGSSADVRYVTFMSYDGLIEYGKKAVAVGDDCADPIARGVFATPTRESNVQYNYTFYGWATTPNGGADANALKAVTEDKTVYANFTQTVRYYTITYCDTDGSVLKTESLAYGSVPEYEPEKSGYAFVGWSPEVSSVTKDTNYTAKWNALSGLKFVSTATSVPSISGMALTNNGTYLVVSKPSGEQSNIATLYNITNQAASLSSKTLSRALYQKGAHVNYADSSAIIAGTVSNVHYLETVNFSSGTSEKSLGGQASVSTVAYSPSSGLYAFQDYENISGGYKYIVEFSNGTKIQTGSTSKIAITKGDKYLVCADSSNGVRLYNIANSALAATFGEKLSPQHISVNADGTKLAVSYSSSPYVAVYSLETFEKLYDLSTVVNTTSYAAFVGDYLVVATGSTVKAYTYTNSVLEECLDIPTYAGGSVSKICTNHNCTHIAFYSSGNIEVWKKV